MMTLSTTLLAFVTASTLALGACSKDDSAAESGSRPTTGEEGKSAPTPEPVRQEEETAPLADTSFAAGIMAPYEVCRALLAMDKSEGIPACATGIVTASKTAIVGAPDPLQEKIEALAKAAEALAATRGTDMEAIRMSFGSVSEAAVAMLSAAPEAGKRYHVFECPMAKGYQRWVQPGAKLENPYMGAKMLRCGSEVQALE